jgi:hypothetical protein
VAAGESAPAQAPAAAQPGEEAAPVPVTAAALGVTRTPARAPLPPSPGAPKPAAPRSASIPAAQAVSSRAAQSRPRTAAPAGSAATAAGAAGTGAGRKDFRQERSPARAIVLVVGGLIVVVLLVIFAVSALKGGSSSPSASQSPAASETTGSARSSTTTHTTSHHVAATNPAQTPVVVLNGTSTAGLAHHLASDLQQSGYTRALASGAVPQGTHQTTVVEYSGGHRADAQGVARKLNVTQVQPMDTTIAGLAGSATVVVLAGADQAALLGGGGAQSQGEPAASGGEAATG